MKFEPPTSHVSVVHNIQLYDVAVAAICPALALVLRDPQGFPGERWPAFALYACVGFVSTLMMYLAFGFGRGLSQYATTGDAIDICKTSVGSVAVSSAFVFTVTRLDDVPRSAPLIHLVLLAAALSMGRIYWFWKHERESPPDLSLSGPGANVIVCGANRLSWFYIRMLDSPSIGRDRVLAVVDDDPKLRRRWFCGRPILGGVENLPAILEEYKTHGVQIDHVMVGFDRLDGLARRVGDLCREGGVGCAFLPERLRLDVEPHAPRPFAVPPVAALARGRGLYWRLKRMADVVVAILLGVGLAPLIVLVWIALLIDVGAPVIFWQRRLGLDGRPFHIYKFRTLRAPFDRTGTMVPEDDRLSPCGALLRRLRFDEIPQLWNILRGDMTLVGPRPLLPVDQPRNSLRRLGVPPGVTGWAQVHGGKLIDPEEKAALDEWYVENACFAVDVRIVLMTFASVFLGDRRDESLLGKLTGGPGAPDPVASDGG